MDTKWILIGVLALGLLYLAETTEGESLQDALEDMWWRTSQTGDNTPTPDALANLVRLRAVVREVFGMDLTVTSAYRSPEVNAAVGGAKRSYHLSGRAVDLAPPVGMTLQDMMDVAKASGRFVEVIPYPSDGHLHVAIR